jgi:hypothetical protein
MISSKSIFLALEYRMKAMRQLTSSTQISSKLFLFYQYEDSTYDSIVPTCLLLPRASHLKRGVFGIVLDKLFDPALRISEWAELDCVARRKLLTARLWVLRVRGCEGNRNDHTQPLDEKTVSPKS